MADRKPFLFRMFDKLSARLEKKTPEEKVLEHLETLRAAFRTELAGLLAAALFAKKTLDTTRQVEAPFPDVYLLGHEPLDSTAFAALASYAMALENFQAECNARGTPLSLAVAKGLTTWIASLHAISIPGLMPQGEEIWTRLVMGEGGLEDAHQFLLRRTASDVERTYFTYRPTVLLPPRG